jgi:hypothetical protein
MELPPWCPAWAEADKKRRAELKKNERLIKQIEELIVEIKHLKIVQLL